MSSRCSGAIALATAIAARAVDEHGAPAGAERGLDLGASRRLGEQPPIAVVDGSRGVLAPRDEHRLPHPAVLGLGEQVGGDELGRRVVVGDHDELRRPGDRVGADDARDLALGQRDVDVARPDDHVDGADGLGAVRERGDRLRATDPVHLVDPGERRGGQRGRRDLPVAAGRHTQNDLRHAGDPRRDRGHEDGRRVVGETAGHIATGPVHGDDDLPGSNPIAIECDRRGYLLLVVHGDLVARVFERSAK